MTPYAPNELEGAALGVVWKLQPCSTYAVRKAFRDSTTAHWNASAGAIYPLITRLFEHGLLDAEEHLHGKRRSVRYTLSPSGLRALQRWVGPPLATDAVSIPGDPMRSRLRFLGCLPAEQRRRWIDEAIDATAEHTRGLEALREQAEAGDEVFWRLAIDGALAMARARVEWLGTIRRTLADRRRPTTHRGARPAGSS